VGDKVTVVVTKTGAQFEKPAAQMFDHVPHLVDGRWI